jgi:hypothetical protein
MSFKEQSVTTYLLTRTNVNRNQEEVLSTTTTAKSMHVSVEENCECSIERGVGV